MKTKVLLVGLLGVVAGGVAGGLAGFQLARPTLESFAQQHYSRLALDYWGLVSPGGEVFTPEQVAANARSVFAMNFVAVAPLYAHLRQQSDRDVFVAVVRGALATGILDSTNPHDLGRRQAHASALCIAGLGADAVPDDPMPCLEAHAEALRQEIPGLR